MEKEPNHKMEDDEFINDWLTWPKESENVEKEVQRKEIGIVRNQPEMKKWIRNKTKGRKKKNQN